MNLGVRVGTLLFKIDNKWNSSPIDGLFDLDFLLKDEFIIPYIEKKNKVKLIGYSKYAIYFLDETRK